MKARVASLVVLCACACALLAGHAAAKPVDGSIGVCTRKEEFKKRQEKLDDVVAKLATETRASQKKSLQRKLVKAAKRDIECLIRYREPHLLPVMAEVATGKGKWSLLEKAGRLSPSFHATLLSWRHSGFSVDASQRVAAGEDVRLERLARYATRVPLALGAVRERAGGKIAIDTPPDPKTGARVKVLDRGARQEGLSSLDGNPHESGVSVQCRSS